MAFPVLVARTSLSSESVVLKLAYAPRLISI